MLESMEERAHPLVVADVLALEHRLGLSLPFEYKAFLLCHNGGRPCPRAFPITGLELNPFGAVQTFFGIDDPIESCNIEWNYEQYSGRVLPNLLPNLLPIACDDGSDLFCLALNGEDAGAVYFWDGYAEQEEPGYANLYLLANSFNEFIDCLQDLPDVSEQ